MKNHIFHSFSIIGAQTVKIAPLGGILEVRVRFCVVEADKYQNNVISMFRNTKVPLENIMGHWDYLFCSLWRIFVILAPKIALKGVSSLINHTSFPCKLYYFFKILSKTCEWTFSESKITHSIVPSHSHRCTLIGLSILTNSVDFKNSDFGDFDDFLPFTSRYSD